MERRFMNKSLLLIFTRNPELGKVKTRLAAGIGAEAALEVYNFLLDHTVSITKDLQVHKQVYYTEAIRTADVWNDTVYEKKLQRGADLGERMNNAFEDGFAEGYKHIIIIGSDLYDITSEDLLVAFDRLKSNDAVIGPAEDGGYYLLGLNRNMPQIFRNKTWGTSTVLAATLTDLNEVSMAKLPMKNDIDYLEDILHIEAFAPFLQHLKTKK